MAVRIATVVCLFTVSCVLIVPGMASANRVPINVSGLSHDRWAFTTSNGEYNLRRRYAGITTVTCYGVAISGDANDSSFIRGLNRYWDKLACEGLTRTGQTFVLICDAKSSTGFIIYRLSGATVSELQAA